ncbi:DNA polymerase-3 subunit gamma/tau [Larkinella arboricola]|uniref:DNA polymerase III subunit gamma/tau n=1 Tax=Larkinella arboricola TaxID=643671 RepID=A0A327WV36_LARAB|nr:DNA polymerase III subunit gamma/tau [Larkinella arboricola]RAJ95581.1 DNA polymerase-3 subunit gamma/tau [Larkinella arboricola]
MDNFVVSARKYRPATFDTVVGQAHITTTLKNAILTNHLAQAFLFCGPRGVGKTTCARILAKTINCQNLGKVKSADAVEPCDQCESCVSFNQNASFNIHELDAASNNSVEDIRNLIDQVRYPPQSGKYKIYIIDEVHMLSQAAFNAFLKTLEEPPSYAIFILATTEKHKILPTILSRCQLFDFNRIQPRDISNHLANIAQKESIQAEYEALELIAQKADGGLRDALSMFDLNVTFSEDRTLRYKEVLENLHILDYDYYFRLTDLLLAANLSQSLLLFDEILRKGFDGHQFIVGLSEHFRNLLVCKDAATIELLQVTETIQQKYLQQAAEAPMSFLLSALSVGAQCDMNYKAAKNQRLHVEVCLMKLANLPNVLDLSALPVLPDSSHQNNTQPAERVEKKKDSSPDNQPVSVNGTNGATAPVPAVEPTNGYHPKPNGNGAVKTVVECPPVVAEIPKPVSSRLRTTTNLVPMERPALVVDNSAATAVIEAPEPPKIDKPFIFEQLKAAWSTFTRLRDQQGGSQTEQVMLNREIVLDGTTIHIALDNSLQVDLLNDLRQDLLTYLRRELQNSQIQLVHSVAMQETRRMIYTPQDKFNYLAEKNPALLELKRTLGLDVDY